MSWFEFICLANSYKLRGRCIAGLLTDGSGWIRPCAEAGSGELYPHQYKLQDGSEPRILDVIRVFCVAPEIVPHQPENWFVGRDRWKLVHRPAPAPLLKILRENLSWGRDLLGDHDRRIAYDQLLDHPAASSLALIAPPDLQWYVGRSPENAKRPRARFHLRGVAYSLPITDPAWVDAFRALDYGTHPVTAIGIESGRKVLLTISLSEPFDDGNCYKLVTAIIPAPFDPPAEPLTPAVILDRLAHGIDPFTGQRLTGPYAHAETVHALRLAAEALRRAEQRQRPQPEHAGKAWESEEEKLVAEAFDDGMSIAAIARNHGRTAGAIRARLIRLGKLQEDEL